MPQIRANKVIIVWDFFKKQCVSADVVIAHTTINHGAFISNGKDAF